MSEGYGYDRGPSEGQIVMPFYLICDVSYSMVKDMGALNDSLQRLKNAIVAKPIVDDVARISIMTFADAAKVVMPLGIMRHEVIPTLSVEGGTNYGNAFRALASAIPADARELRQQGCKVFRPCAFFLTDGEPLDDDWYQTFRDTLTYDRATNVGMKQHPAFIPFGFRDAPEDVLRRLAYPMDKARWYHARTSSVEEALNGIMGIIMKTVVSSGLSAASTPALVHPAVTSNTISYGAAEEFIEDDVY